MIEINEMQSREQIGDGKMKTKNDTYFRQFRMKNDEIKLHDAVCGMTNM